MSPIESHHESRIVLVADDSDFARAVAGATLALEEHTVLEAGDGERAWDLIRAHRPDVAVLDVDMPGRSGLELTRAIRADADLAHATVILVTALVAPSDQRAGLAAGADHYLSKPFSPLQLLELVAA